MNLFLTQEIDEQGNKVCLGTLSCSDGVYHFRYSDEYNNSSFPREFYIVPGFKEFDEEYESKKLFWFFADRMMPKSRPDFKEHLARLGMTEFDEWEYLKRTGSRLMTDGYELVESL
ncbi:hypothetical protein AGMMS49975_20950 [Clostridia bacterium]|nr:hypothetical protein AGMMS49975_20950 [Clostridia bacterium]